MHEMKDSGIEWIGEIPAPWGVKRLKYVTKLRNEKGMFSPGADDYIGLENVRSYRNEIVATDSQYEPSIQSICRKGDVMFGRLRPYLAKVIIVPADSFCTGEFLQFSWFSGDKRFLRYFLLSPGFIEHVNASTYGTKMPRANTEFIINSAMVCPPLVEQTDIATFLDDKCAEIDSISKDIKDQIEILEEYKQSVISEAVTKGLNPGVEMKDSGIEWIGEMPKNWDIKKGKYLFRQRNEKGNNIFLQLLSPTQRFGVIPQSMYEELTGMSAVKLNENVDLNFMKTIHKGDFCISLRSFQGGFEYSKYEGVVSPAYRVFFPSVKIVDGYYKYLFKESGFIEKMNSYTMTLRDGKNISFADFGNTYIPLPPLSDQQAIATFLDNKCAEIDSIIADKEELLTILDEYKKSLIYEYVTGKKEAPTA